MSTYLNGKHLHLYLSRGVKIFQGYVSKFTKSPSNDESKQEIFPVTTTFATYLSASVYKLPYETFKAISCKIRLKTAKKVCKHRRKSVGKRLHVLIDLLP